MNLEKNEVEKNFAALYDFLNITIFQNDLEATRFLIQTKIFSTSTH